MEHLIITISRTYGSGGSVIGRSVAGRLGIDYYDRNSIDEIAHQRGLDQAYISQWQRDISSLEMWGIDTPTQKWNMNCWKTGSSYYCSEREMFLIQSDIILELAERGPCVIVGRCADHVLGERKKCLRVWIDADEDSRVLRLYDEYGVRVGSLADKLKMVDSHRAIYYKRCTGTPWGDPENFHLALDSGTLGAEKCAKKICSAAKSLLANKEGDGASHHTEGI